MNKTVPLIVIVLLVAILGMQVYTFMAPSTSQACLDAKAAASEKLSSLQNLLTADVNGYQTDVYDTTQNINQQIFLAQEHTYTVDSLSAKIEALRLTVEIECR